MQRVTKAAIIFLLALLTCAGLGSGIASADPGSGSTPGNTAGGPASGKSLPKDFPGELKQFVGGTDEFKSGPWFSGECKDRGGDVGQYIQASMAQESKLLYWSMSDEDRKKIADLGNSGVSAGAGGLQKLFDTFPAGDTNFAPPSGYCADDLKRWASPTTTVWGFDWADAPDEASLAAMKRQPNADKVPDARWKRSTACSQMNDKNGGMMYCAHAFFLDCSKANQGSDQGRCLAWNTRIGKLFGGTANWVDQNKSVADRISEVADAVTAPQRIMASSYVDAWTSIFHGLNNIKKFVENPGNFIDDWANAFKETAVSMTNGVLKNLAGVGEFRDLFSPWFVRLYAISEALGLLVMSMMVLMVGRSISGGQISRGDVIPILFRDMPGSIMAMMITPVVVQWMLELSNSLTDVFLKLVQTTVPDLLNNLNEMWYSLDQKTLLGGALMAIVSFGLVIIGDILLLIGMLMKVVGVPLLTVAIAIGLGMWVHPRWRKKCMAPVWTVTGLIFSTPIMFLGLAIIFNIMNSAALRSSSGSGEIKSLSQVILVAFCIITMGIAPWSALKWTPVLPTASDALGPSGTAAFSGAGGGRMAGDAMRSARNQATGPSVMPARSSDGGGRGGVNGANGAAGPPGRSGPAGLNGAGGPLYNRDPRSGNRTPQAAGGGLGGRSVHVGGAQGSSQRSFGAAFAKGAGTTTKAAASVAAVGIPMAATAARAAVRTTGAAADGPAPRPE